MKNLRFKKVALLLIAVLSFGLLAGCGSSPKKEEKSAATSTTITVGEAKIVLGVTLLQELKTQGFELFYDKQLQTPIPQEEIMPGRTYDVGIYLSKDGLLYGTLQCLNDKEEEIPYLDSIINQVEAYYAASASPYDPPYYMESVLVDGVDFKGMNAEELMAAVKDTTEEEPKAINFPDESVAFISFSRNNCYFSFGFDMETHLISTLEAEMFHAKF